MDCNGYIKLFCESDNPFYVYITHWLATQRKVVSLSEQVKSLTSDIAQFKIQDTISNTDEVDGLHTSATDVDQSSNGHPHTLPSQDKSKQSHKYCLKRKKKRTVIKFNCL